MLRFISKHVVIDLDYKNKQEIRMNDYRLKLKGIHWINPISIGLFYLVVALVGGMLRYI